MESIETKLNQRQFLLSPFLVHEVNFFCHEEGTDRSHPSLLSVLSEMNLMKLSLGLPVSHISKELHLFFYETILCNWVDISFLKTHFIKFFQRTVICRKQTNPLYTIYGQCHIHLQQFVVINITIDSIVIIVTSYQQ